MRALWWAGGPWFWGPSRWPFGPLLMLGFWAVLIVVIVVLARRVRRLSPAGSDSTLGILRTRYAKGEIGREEFETMRRELMAR